MILAVAKEFPQRREGKSKRCKSFAVSLAALRLGGKLSTDASGGREDDQSESK
jgi:hypothetical protein